MTRIESKIQSSKILILNWIINHSKTSFSSKINYSLQKLHILTSLCMQNVHGTRGAPCVIRGNIMGRLFTASSKYESLVLFYKSAVRTYLREKFKKYLHITRTIQLFNKVTYCYSKSAILKLHTPASNSISDKFFLNYCYVNLIFCSYCAWKS